MKTHDQDHYQALCRRILERSKERGVSTAEVTLASEKGFEASVRLGQVETVTHQNDQHLSLTVYFDKQCGSASTTDFSDQAIDVTIEKACSIAKFTNQDPFAGLADKEQLAFAYPTLDINFPWQISTEQALDLALQCENLARQDSRITNSEGATVSSHTSLHVYGNTHDFVGSYAGSQHAINCILIAERDGHKQRSYDYTVARDADDLMSVEQLAKNAALKTINRLGAKRLKTQSAPVIFSAEVAKTLVGHFIAAISGSNIYRQSSFLIDYLNKPIFPKHINITQLPHLPKALGTIPFDNEGVLTVEQDFVHHGILKNYLLNSYAARKLNMKSTGNAGGLSNLLVSSNDLTQAELIKEMQRGLLVVELIGQGVNIVTGDYSRGAFGYWVENGEIQYPVTEITIAGNLKDIFQNIVAIANDIDNRNKIRSGSILVKEMMIAGE